MARTIIRSYESYERAASVVGELEGAGVPVEDISLVAGSMDAIEQGANEGAEAGGLIGGGAGLLGALITLPIPGIGPVLSAGWLIGGTAVGAVAGAAAGSLVGALTGAGVDENDAHIFAEMVKRGGAVVAVRASERHAAVAAAIMASGRPVDPTAMRKTYESEGWTRFDEETDAARQRDNLSGVVS
jgi:hypothetical protein